MALIDSVLSMVTRKGKPELDGGDKPLSRSEKEAKIKDKAGLVINAFAALLAFNTWVAGGLSSTIMNNTIKANDTWNFYQAKSIKQTQYELTALSIKDPVLIKRFNDKAASYDEGVDGKKALYAEAKKLEADRDVAKRKSPWIGYASTAYQLSIVLLSASILAVNMMLFRGSFVVAGIGLLLMLEGLFLFF
jgi:hypothetical protein